VHMRPAAAIAQGDVVTLLATRLIRYELPARYASHLLNELRRRGVDGLSVFPGMHGFARNAMDRALSSVALQKLVDVGPDDEDTELGF